ncbi:MAG TPA: PAS domain S-box protein [Gemmatimonadaceae bacterium]|nr:PAS domain S-box protein [Gemmatimonadaceae bacterium]
MPSEDVQYREMVEVASDGICTLDLNGVLTSVNAALEALLGVPREQLLGRSLLPFADGADQPRMRSQLDAAAGGSPRRCECLFTRADGARRLVSVSLSPLRVAERVTGVLGVARDVTDERARAAALERVEAGYTRLVESAEDAIATLDEEGNLTSVNCALERTTGRRRDRLVGTHFTELVRPAERATLWRAFVNSLGGERQRSEVRFTHRDGRAGVATVLSAPVVERGRITGVLAIARDVTEERALIEQVVRREKLAALGEMIGGVAHEINTPLTGILAFSQILMARTEEGDARQAAASIAHEAKRAARIVGQLLTFARQNPPERMRTDVNQVVRETLAVRRLALESQGIEVATDLDPRLPVTWADAFQLQQVFVNLLANAEQALSGRSGVRLITVRSRREADRLVVAVQDSGDGIAPEHIVHIFNPFYTTKPRGIGTGLGLSISHGIVREHDGSLRVHSEPGQGATFEVVLPLVSPRESVKSPGGTSVVHGEHTDHR